MFEFLVSKIRVTMGLLVVGFITIPRRACRTLPAPSSANWADNAVIKSLESSKYCGNIMAWEVSRLSINDCTMLLRYTAKLSLAALAVAVVIFKFSPR